MKRLNIFFSAVFSLGFLGIWCGIFLNNKDNVVRYNQLWMHIMVVVLIIVIAVCGFLDFPKIRKIIVKNKRKLLIIFAIALLAIQIFLSLNLYAKSSWDVAVVMDYAYNIAHNSVTQANIDHMELYPNLAFMVSAYSFIFKVFAFLPYELQYFAFIVINIIIIDLAMLLIFSVAKTVFNKKTAIIAVILYILLFVFSPWMIVPYSDTMSIALPIFIFWLYLKAEKKSGILKFPMYIIIGAVAMIGYYIKPQVIIICIAIIIVLMWRSLVNFRKEKSNLISIVSIVVGVVLLSIIFNFSMNIVFGDKLKSEKRVVPTHYLMMGLNIRHTQYGDMYGAWNGDDLAYTQSFKTVEDRTAGNIEEIKRRLSNYGPIGYSKFLWHKANWIMGDATYFWMWEGEFLDDFSYNGSLTQNVIRDFFYANGNNYKVYATGLTSIWMIILLFMLIPFRNKEKNYDKAILKFGIVGIVVFTLLFEGRSRYLINYIPIFIVLASGGISQFQNYIKGGRQ